MSEFVGSVYTNPEYCPFAAFISDMTPEQYKKSQTTVYVLWGHMENGEGLSDFARFLYFAIVYGYPTHTEYEKCRQISGGMNRLAAWWNFEKKLMEYLTYDKVRGVKVAQMRLVPFIRRVLQTYRTYSEFGEPLVAEDVAPFVTQLFPALETYKVEVIDDAAQLYDKNTMGHIDSCMVGKEYVKFYTTAPVKGLIIRNKSGKAVGRTLLWTLDDGRQVHDRLYRVDEFAATALHKWAKDNNVLSKVPDGAKVTAPKCKYGYPYMDTFSYGAVVDNNIVLFYNYSDADYYIHNNIDEDSFYSQIFDMDDTDGGDPYINAAAMKKELAYESAST